MKTLAIDIGTSSVKAAVVTNGRVVGKVGFVALKSERTINGDRAQIDANHILDSIAHAIRQLGPVARRVDVIAAAVMAPSWVAIDAKGRAISHVVTHQDRRSIAEAHAIEKRIGREAHLSIVGCRPVPGGISSTSAAWFKKHSPSVIARAKTLGHFQTLLHQSWCGRSVRVIDPSNASFTGFFNTRQLHGWNTDLLAAADIQESQMPEVRQANERAGVISVEGAARFGLTEGTPTLVGCMDTSAAMLLAGAKRGRLVNVAGSTDVLGVCVDRFMPDERVLTRGLGVGKLWMSVSTIAAAGSAIEWALSTLYSEIAASDRKNIHQLLANLKYTGTLPEVATDFAGSRVNLEQPTASIAALRLGTTREDILAGIIVALSRQSAARLAVLKEVNHITLGRKVFVSGGYAKAVEKEMYRHWPAKFERTFVDQATLLGLEKLATLAC